MEVSSCVMEEGVTYVIINDIVYALDHSCYEYCGLIGR